MQFLITQGLGSAGDGSASGMQVTTGLGSSGSPVTPACLALQVLAVSNFANYLIFTFSNTLQAITGPAADPTKYPITGPGTVQASAVSIQTPGNLLRVDTTEQQTGGTYQITLPTQGLMDVNGNVINGPFTWTFSGIGVPVVVQIAKSIDERTLEIVFSKPVLQADAIIPSKYTVTPTLSILSVARITDQVYRLTTGPQTINQDYVVDASGIRDINGNL